MPITLAKKIIKSDKLTDLVFQCYQKALRDFTVTEDPLAADEKAVKHILEIDEKKDEGGILARILRITNISNAASYELEEMNVNVEEMSGVFYKSFQATLLKELARAVYSDTHIQGGIGKASSLLSHPVIDNHYMFICEIISRIIASALDENLIKKRKPVSMEADDKVVALLKRFVAELKLTPDRTTKLFAKKTPKGKLRASTLVAFLDDLVEYKSAEINTLIHNVQDIDAPKARFKAISAALDGIQKRLRGFLLVYLDLVYKKLLNKPLITDNNNLSKDMIISYYTVVMKTLLEENSGLLREDSKEEKRVTIFTDDNLKIIKLLNLKTAQVNDDTEKLSLKHSINEVKKLFALDEQLNAIKDAVNEFLVFANLGGWIPVYLKFIRPEVLSIVINRFQESCTERTKISFAYLNEHSDFSLGLVSLPPFMWSTLKAINVAIWELTSPEMMARIYEKFDGSIIRLNKVQEVLIRHGLLDSNQHLMASKVPQLPPPQPLYHSATHTEGFGEVLEEDYVSPSGKSQSYDSYTTATLTHSRSETSLNDSQGRGDQHTPYGAVEEEETSLPPATSLFDHPDLGLYDSTAVRASSASRTLPTATELELYNSATIARSASDHGRTTNMQFPSRHPFTHTRQASSSSIAPNAAMFADDKKSAPRSSLPLDPRPRKRQG